MVNPILLNLRVPSKLHYHSSLETTKNIYLDHQMSKKGKSHHLPTHLLPDQEVSQRNLFNSF